MKPPPRPRPGGPSGRVQESRSGDKQTLDALRSLGYLAGGASGGAARSKTAKSPPAATAKDATAAAVPPKPAAPPPAPPAGASPAAGMVEGNVRAATTTAAEPTDQSVLDGVNGAGEGMEPAPPAPAGIGQPLAARAATPVGAETRPLIVPLSKAPEQGRDHQVIRSAEAWQALLAGSTEKMPEIDFQKEMVVVLRDDLGGDPPARLRVVSVSPGSEGLVIECRSERLDSAAAPPAGGPARPGQGLIVPASDLPVRIVMK
jgi:hypothetical protein